VTLTAKDKPEPNAPHSMIWGTPGDTTWAWQLDAHPDGSTRLIARVRSRYHWRFDPRT